MNNIFFNIFRSRIKIKITSKNVKNFINKLTLYNIELLNIKYINNKEAIIEIYKNDLKKLEDIKTIYEINIIGASGYIMFKHILKIDKIIIFFLIIGLLLIYFLSNVIFSIDIIHTDKEIVSLLRKELAHYGIEEKHRKKTYNEITEIKKKILDKYKDKIEWLEIENIGTKYIVRVEERKIINPSINNELRHVVAKKNAIIKKIVATKGVVVKDKNSYVNKGDIIISGEVTLNDEIKNYTSASGKVYGEVWYTVKTNLPFFHSEKKQTGKHKDLILIKFMSNYYGFNFKKYNNATIRDKTLIKNKLLPISLVYQKQIETIDNSYLLTPEEANIKAIEKSRKIIEDNLLDTEYIIYEKQLKKEVKNSKIVVEMFYSVYEDITDYVVFNREE